MSQLEICRHSWRDRAGSEGREGGDIGRLQRVEKAVEGKTVHRGLFLISEILIDLSCM